MTNNDDSRILTVDAESDGLAGQVFCVAMNVTTALHGPVLELDSVVFRCPISPPVEPWVETNVLPAIADVDVDCADYRELLTKVLRWHRQWTELGVRTLTHVPWPVEARLFTDLYPGSAVWDGPYPLLDVAPLLFAAGYDPTSVDAFLQERGVAMPQGSPHNPLYDVRAAATAWWHLVRGRRGDAAAVAGSVSHA